jgi:hypothetical protein
VSNVVVAWEGERPATQEAAIRIYDELMDRYFGVPDFEAPEPPQQPLTPAIASLLEALLARWPDITEPGGENSPWADGPILNNAVRPIVRFSIIASMLKEVVSEVVREASIHGLVCFAAGGRLIHIGG